MKVSTSKSVKLFSFFWLDKGFVELYKTVYHGTKILFKKGLKKNNHSIRIESKLELLIELLYSV